MEIRSVGIVGAGTMGGGIAINLAQHGLDVRLVDNTPAAAERAVTTARTFFARAVEKGRMAEADAAAAGERLAPAAGIAELADSDLVIEAVFEDRDLKAKILAELSGAGRHQGPDRHQHELPADSDLAQAVQGPERFLGLHYFSPAAVNPIVEVVEGAATASTTIEAALAFCRATGKQPLRCKDAYGFAINRFFCPYTNEAARALDEGLGSTAQIDEVAKENFGAAAGPFQVMNLIKPRINLDAIRHLAPLGEFYAPAASMIATGEADGSWEIGTSAPLEPDLESAIADRLRRGAFLPVLQALDEEVASPADIDRGAKEALKLSKPPCALMDALGRTEVERILAPALAAHGIALPLSIARLGTLVT